MKRIYNVVPIILLISFTTIAYVATLSPPQQLQTQKIDPQTVGICVHYLSTDDAQIVSQAGVRWIRIDCNGTQFGEWVKTAKAYNFSVLAILGSWMYNGSCNITLKEWNQSVTYYVTRYAPYVDAWEIWNEPTSTTLGWQLQIDYTSMTQIASPIIRQNDPTAKIVLLGGMQLYTGGADGAASDREFAENLQAKNISQYADAISVHAYPWSGNVQQNVWDSYNDSLEFYHGLFLGKEIWVTETGQSIEDAAETGQNSYLETGLPFFQGKADMVFWYCLRDIPDDLKSFGLLDSCGNPREVYPTLQKLLAP